jgi:hypothetical protein
VASEPPGLCLVWIVWKWPEIDTNILQLYYIVSPLGRFNRTKPRLFLKRKGALLIYHSTLTHWRPILTHLQPWACEPSGHSWDTNNTFPSYP